MSVDVSALRAHAAAANPLTEGGAELRDLLVELCDEVEALRVLVPVLDDYDVLTIEAVDRLLHRVKQQHRQPPGNPVFRLLHQISLPVCNALSERAARSTETDSTL